MGLLLVIASVGLAVILCVVFKRLVTAIADYNERIDALKDIPCDNRHWFFGNARFYNASKLGMTREIQSMKMHPIGFQKWFGPFIMNVTGYRPEMGAALLRGNEPKVNFAYSMFIPWIGEGLLTSKGPKWKRNRRLLTPVFHFDALKRYLPCANIAARDMIRRWKSDKLESRSVEMFHEISKTTLDTLLRSLFSKQTGCESEYDIRYLKSVKNCTTEIEQRYRNPFYFFDFVYYLTPAGRRYKRALTIAHEYTENVIRKRIKEIAKAGEYKSASEYDFLDVLLMAKDENGNGLSHKEVRDELDTFVFEGHDTVTSGISWTLYNLAIYPGLQKRCRKEVLDVLNGGSLVEWKNLSKFEYLTKFIKETLRLYPPVLQVGRQITHPIRFPRGFDSNNCDNKLTHSGRTFPKNTNLSLKIFLLHRNPEIWENPEDFDPERFNPDNIARRSPHAYIPFSAGSRNCIGQNFAMNEMKVIVASILTKFNISIDSSYPPPEIEPTVVLGSTTGIHLLVENL